MDRLARTGSDRRHGRLLLSIRIHALVIVATALFSTQGCTFCRCPGVMSSWDAESGELAWSVDIGGRNRVSLAAISDDSSTVATLAVPDAYVTIRDIRTGEINREIHLPGFGWPRLQPVFSRNLRWLAAVTDRSPFTLWDLDTGDVHTTLDGVYWAGFSSDSSRLLTYRLAGQQPDDRGVWTSVGMQWTTTAPTSGSVTWWDIEARVELGSVATEGLQLLVLRSATGDLALRDYPGDSGIGGGRPTVLLEDVNRVGTLEIPDRADVALAGSLSEVREWDSRRLIYSGLVQFAPPPSVGVQWTARSPRGDKLVRQYQPEQDYDRCGPFTRNVELWDMRDRQLLRTFDHPILAGALGAVFVSETQFLTFGPRCACFSCVPSL